MKHQTLWASMAIVGAAFLMPTASMASVSDGFDLASPNFDISSAVTEDDGSYETARRGRGRGGDRSRDDDRRKSGKDRSDDRRDDRSSGRDRARVPGGSGCDDAGDILEHPECQGGSGASTGGSSTGGNGHGGRPRIPGGSGCDDPQDVIEHQECRL